MRMKNKIWMMLILRLKNWGILIDLSWQGFLEMRVQDGSELVRFLLKWLCVFIICFLSLQIDMEMILIWFMIVIFHC